MPRKNTKTRIYRYPDPDKVQINKANFELKLRDYKTNIKSKFARKDLLLLVPAWAILFTSNFNSIWFLSGEEIKGIYLAFMIFGTLDSFKNKIPVIKNFFNGNSDVIEVMDNITKECK